MMVSLSRVDDDTLSLHLEVALSTAPPFLLDRLTDADRHRRHAAVSEIARQLVDRLRCFDIGGSEMGHSAGQPSLFPEDLGPIG
jgi:hypothetical protein